MEHHDLTANIRAAQHNTTARLLIPASWHERKHQRHLPVAVPVPSGDLQPQPQQVLRLPITV
jgi:hypothetical protein